MRRHPNLGVASPNVSTEIPGGLILSQLGRILQSGIFSHAERLSRFLRYVVERTVRGEADEIKEYHIGLDVFDRDHSFDPRVDSIVRVEAARLRSKLKLYYRTEGRQDALQISLPKGGYAPRLRRQSSNRTPPIRFPPGHDSAETTIAVLPFASLSAEEDQPLFCAGLTEELIHVLTKLQGLRVVACHTVQKLPTSDIQETGQRLNVSTLLQGSVRQAGDRLRIDVHLVRVADGSYLWSESFDRDISDVLAVQEGIGQAVAYALKLELLGDRGHIHMRKYTSNAKAYGAYLKGRYHLNKRTDQGLKKGIDYFQQAIALEPSYAPAYAGNADAHALMGWYGYAPPHQVMPEAERSALRALELDPHMSDAHISLALVHELYHWRWSEAKREFKLAIELNPTSTTALFEYGLLLSRTERLDEALVHVAHALELEPLSAVVTCNLGVIYYYRRQYHEALDLYVQALELDKEYWPCYFRLGLTYLQMGNTREATLSFRRARSLTGGKPLLMGMLGYCHGVAGRCGKAQEVLNALEALRKQEYVPRLCMAVVALGIGDLASVLAHLEGALDERDIQAVDLRIDPLYDRLHSEPAFVTLLKTMGF